MLRITFEYMDAYTNGMWNRQQCTMSSVEECIRVYGLGKDCDYRIISVEDQSKENHNCWTLDEKMGQTYVHEECANTLAQRDYKQPQAVVYESHRNDSRPSNAED